MNWDTKNNTLLCFDGINGYTDGGLLKLGKGKVKILIHNFPLFMKETKAHTIHMSVNHDSLLTRSVSDTPRMSYCRHPLKLEFKIK